MYFITTKRMLEVCFSAHPNIQYRTLILMRLKLIKHLCTLLGSQVHGICCMILYCDRGVNKYISQSSILMD